MAYVQQLSNANSQIIIDQNGGALGVKRTFREGDPASVEVRFASRNLAENYTVDYNTETNLVTVTQRGEDGTIKTTTTRDQVAVNDMKRLWEEAKRTGQIPADRIEQINTVVASTLERVNDEALSVNHIVPRGPDSLIVNTGNDYSDHSTRIGDRQSRSTSIAYAGKPHVLAHADGHIDIVDGTDNKGINNPKLAHKINEAGENAKFKKVLSPDDVKQLEALAQQALDESQGNKPAPTFGTPGAAPARARQQ